MSEMMQNMMGGGGLWWLWMLVPLLMWVGLIALISWAALQFFPARHAEDRSEIPRDSAEETLRERFARGEIDAEEFERSLEILRGGPSDGSTETSRRSVSNGRGDGKSTAIPTFMRGDDR
ncbi:MAG: SHOCT domain-containing protein [Rubrobacteraceae bacterium]|jgi:uncharacterized membrane protein